MPIVDEEQVPRPTEQSRRRSVDPHAEKSTKALVGLALLVAIGVAMYGLGTKPNSDAPSQVVARNVAH